MSMLSGWSHTVVFILYLLTSLAASVHALLYKRDSRAAVSWILTIWFSPFLGSILYFFFGINRIQRKATRLRLARLKGREKLSLMISQSESGAEKTFNPSLKALGSKINPRLLAPGNQIELLENGEAAYPEMLKSIQEAKSTISLASYIFDQDPIGKKFTDALSEAQQRGVQVRVLVDDVGTRKTSPTIVRSLETLKIHHANFLPIFRPQSSHFLNLRNHRKLLVADGRVAFTGGMNISQDHCILDHPKLPTLDCHFKVLGPVVTQLQQVFIEDWHFATQEVLEGPLWFPDQPISGSAWARAVPDGPEETLDRVQTLIFGALSTAQKTIRIQTPYFIPDPVMISAIQVACFRGVQVQILIPKTSDQPWIYWATQSMLWQIISAGCQVSLSQGPFDHSKVFIQDQDWVLLGSSNLDPRSFRLNFELNVECFDAKLATTLQARFDRMWNQAQPVLLQDLENRSIGVRLRDGVMRLFSPYL